MHAQYICPALMAILSADANPMRRELQAITRMSKSSGDQIARNISGAHGGVKSGVIAESLTLLREIGAGRWSRVPGSFTLLLQRMGVLNLILGKSANVSRVLADAWAVQADKAGIAAVAAVRKAGASLAAFMADEAETGATLEAAVADERKAEAAILNAKATQQKAIASSEAAVASEAEGAATSGSLGLIGASLAVVAVGALAVYETFWGFKKALQGMEMPNLKVDYIAKLLRSSGDAANAQRNITNEIKKTVEAYNSAASAAERVSGVTKSHFEHLKRMNEFEKDPSKKAANSLAIDQQERQAELANKYAEKANLEAEAQRKSSEAAKIRVASESEDADKKRQLDENAQAAEAYLKKIGGWSMDNVKQKLAIGFGGNPLDMASRKRVMDAAGDMNYDTANSAITLAHKFADQEQTNKLKREAKSDAEKAAITASAAAAKLGLEIPTIARNNAQADADAREEAEAKRQSERKFTHGHVSALQQVGAYAMPAVMVDTAKASLHELKGINSKLSTIGAGPGRTLGSQTRY